MTTPQQDMRRKEKETFTTEAATLEDLHSRIAAAIKLLGDDAEWGAYGDNKIHIWSRDEKTLLVIKT